jgi:antitoxin component of RelBE/YafQ-DinJ toxin-antitoxin module
VDTVTRTRNIRPYKGGRTETINIRLTPDAKQGLEELAKSAGMTAADLIDWWVQRARETARRPVDIGNASQRPGNPYSPSNASHAAASRSPSASTPALSK